eukprot:symbB.v1.2.020196.t1/scaffold1681.1/size106035/7
MAMPIQPMTPAESRKAAIRRFSEPLAEGRPVLPATGSAREKFWKAFLDWASSESLDIAHLLDHPGTYVEEINAVICRYGRLLYEAGKTYNQYAETINSLTSMRPSLRRQMQGAWDWGFAWMRLEPPQHHIAMPAAILIGMVTTSLLWGWTHFAGCIALAWGSLLRPGELFTLKRANLLFPADTGNTISYLLISLMEPKTRFTTARHQSTRLDIPDLLKLVTLIFGRLPPHFPLWPFSPQTFRNRFRSVLSALDMPTEHSRDLKCLDPGSLRAGGATWLMQTTDNGELVRRRGRWQNHRIMEVYIQEVSSLLYLQKLPRPTRDKIIEDKILFGKGIFYFGGNRGRGQVYPEGNQSNNNQFVAAATGTISAIDGLKVSITTPSGEVKTQECLTGADIVVQVGDEVTKDEPITTNPNVGGFGQEEKECILQDMNRVYAYCAFAFSCFIAQLSFVLKKKQFEKVQLAEGF